MFQQSFQTSVGHNLFALYAGHDRPPRCKSARVARHQRRQFGTVPLDHAFHPIVGDPVHAERGVDLRAEIDGQETVALQTARCHQDEDSESGITEAEALWWRLAEQADDSINEVDFAINILEQTHILGIRGEVLPASETRLMKTGPEIIVARYSAAPCAHEVDHRQIDNFAVALEPHQRIWKVMQCDRSRIRYSE